MATIDYITATGPIAQSVLTDTATITRPAAPTINQTTLAATYTDTVVTDCVKCMVGSDSPTTVDRDNNQHLDIARTRIRFPLGTDIAHGDTIIVTASQNAGLVGNTYLVDTVDSHSLMPLLNVHAERVLRRD